MKLPILVLLIVTPYIASFTIPRVAYKIAVSLNARRYGPPMDPDDEDTFVEKGSSLTSETKEAFRTIVDEISSAKNIQFIPSILTKNVEFLIRVSGGELAELVTSLRNDMMADERGQDIDAIDEALEYIVEFVESFVDEAAKVDKQNKELLGKIVKTLADKELSSLDREQKLDTLIKNERFTAGFLRHLEGECNRIERAASMSPESVKMLQVLRMVQVRVLEEFGKELGEAAQVLGQLIAYDIAEERMAVLDAGLTVQGVAFAQDMKGMTEEALEGFQRVPGGADPELVSRVTEIDGRLEHFLAQNASFQ